MQRLVKSRLLATTRPNRTSLFNNNTLNAHHSYIATGMRVIVECTTMFKISGDCQHTLNTHNTAEGELNSCEGEPVHETPDYTQELYIWSVKVTWIYTVVH